MIIKKLNIIIASIILILSITGCSGSVKNNTSTTTTTTVYPYSDNLIAVHGSNDVSEIAKRYISESERYQSLNGGDISIVKISQSCEDCWSVLAEYNVNSFKDKADSRIFAEVAFNRDEHYITNQYRSSTKVIDSQECQEKNNGVSVHSSEGDCKDNQIFIGMVGDFSDPTICCVPTE